jgi:hypothetical protein
MLNKNDFIRIFENNKFDIEILSIKSIILYFHVNFKKVSFKPTSINPTTKPMKSFRMPMESSSQIVTPTNKRLIRQLIFI